MTSRKKRTIDELMPLPYCLQFTKFRDKLGDCFYYAIREKSLAQLCLIEGAIQTHNIVIIKQDSLSALWYLFSSLYEKSLVVSNEEIKLYNKFFEILLQNNSTNLNNIQSGLFEALWFLDDAILKCRLMQILQECVLPFLSFLDCYNWILCLFKEKKLLMRVKNEVGMEEDSFDDIIKLFQTKRKVEYIYVLEKKLSYICPSVIIMISQLNF